RDPRHVREVEARVLEALLPRRGRELGVALLAEALLPRAGAQVTRFAPAVEELAGDGGAAEVHGGELVLVAVTDEHRRAGVAAVALLGGAGRAGAHVAGEQQHRGLG